MMKNLNSFLQYADEICYNCYMGVHESIDPISYQNLFTSDELLLNILFNAGYMYTDIYNIATNSPATVSNWAYFLAYNVGDFMVRFLYRTEYW